MTQTRSSPALQSQTRKTTRLRGRAGSSGGAHQGTPLRGDPEPRAGLVLPARPRFCVTCSFGILCAVWGYAPLSPAVWIPHGCCVTVRVSPVTQARVPWDTRCTASQSTPRLRSQTHAHARTEGRWGVRGRRTRPRSHAGGDTRRGDPRAAQARAGAPCPWTRPRTRPRGLATPLPGSPPPQSSRAEKAELEGPPEVRPARDGSNVQEQPPPEGRWFWPAAAGAVRGRCLWR